MNDYRYILEKGSKKFPCPACFVECRKKTFVRYIDTETGDYLPDQYGRCDREISCGYHAGPKEYFRNENFRKLQIQHLSKLDTRTLTKANIHHCENLTKLNIQNLKKLETRNLIKPEIERTFSCVPQDMFRRSRAAYEANNLVQYLLTVFDPETVSGLIARYHIGTSKHWPGSTVFWQIDRQGRIRTGKIMQYSPSTGKRIKEPFNRIAWVHKALKTPDFTLKQCLFGSHLLYDETKPVAIVESEKTAIISSVYLPQFIWLATGGLSNLNAEQFQPLDGRRVVLFPDLGAFDKWSGKVNGVPDVTVSDFLEINASEQDRDKGLDLADYLVRIPLKDFLRVNSRSVKNEFLESITRTRDYEFSESIKRVEITETWMPDGWYYHVWSRYDGIEVKTLVNGIEGYPAAWDDPKLPKQAAALLIDENPTMLRMMDKLDLAVQVNA